MFGLFDIISQQSNFVIILGTAVVGFIIVIAGSRLSQYGDKLADVSGLSSSWIGMILLATITSVPELASSITASVSDVPDIGVGNVFGSNMFNMFIIAILDFLQGPGPVLLSVSATQILPAALGILLTAIAAGGIFAATHFAESNNTSGNIWGWIFSLLILASWIIGVYISYKTEQTSVSDEEFTKKPSKREKKSTITKFGISSLIVIIMGIILIGFAKTLASRTFSLGSLHITLGNSFVGTIIVALLTSLPELVVAISAYKIGAVNMAIANLLGSNTFNIVLIPIMEIVTGKKSILASVEPYHIITASFAIIMTTIAIMGVVYRSRKSFFYLGWDALSILGFYLLGTYLIFQITITVH
ncbi:sodium:calcium antiporter [bacterium]|nr:MAG: sodium:calcium antiporter [bacterium]